jgi:hypothetical protein
MDLHHFGCTTAVHMSRSDQPSRGPLAVGSQAAAALQCFREATADGNVFSSSSVLSKAAKKNDAKFKTSNVNPFYQSGCSRVFCDTHHRSIPNGSKHLGFNCSQRTRQVCHGSMYGTMVVVSQRAGDIGGPLEIFRIAGCYAERSTSDVSTVNVTKNIGSGYNC